MTEKERFTLWQKHRTKGMNIKEIMFFKKSDELHDAKLIFFENERKKLTPTEFMYWIEKKAFEWGMAKQ